MADKIYCGSGKTFGEYGQVNASICLDDIPGEHITTSKNGKRYVNIKVCKKREADQWGKTHYIEVDTWKPNQQKAPAQTGQPTGTMDMNTGNVTENQEVPF